MKLLYVGLIASAISLGIVEAVEVESDLVYGSAIDYAGSNVVLKLDAYYENSTQTNRPVVILTHGGGFTGGDKGATYWQGDFYPDIATAFATNGFVAFSINYRLANNPLPVNTIDNATEDVMTALSWIRAHALEYGIDASKVLIAGDSAGGGLAINVSYQSDRVDSFFGCISLWGGLPPYGGTIHEPIEDQYPPITAQSPPMLLVHGSIDPVIPYVNSVSLASVLTTAGVYNELYTLDTSDHYPVVEPSPVYHEDLANHIIGHMLSFAKLTASGLLSSPVRLGDHGIQVVDGHFSFDITGPTNMLIEIEQSTNQMESWYVVATNQLLGGTVWFTNDIMEESQFYRVQSIAP